MVDKKDYITIGSVTLGVILIISYLLSVFTDWDINLYALIFIPMIALVFWVILRLMKVLSSGDRITLDQIVLFGAIILILGIVFLKLFPSNNPFSIVVQSIMGMT